MYETYLMMESIATNDFENDTLEELADKYKSTLNSSIFATAYVKLYKILYHTAKKYENSVSWDDLVSYSLEVLDKCLQIYKEEKGIKFVTFFLKCYERRAIMLANRNNKLTVPPVCDTAIDDLWFISHQDQYDFNDDLLKSLDLSEREKKYCYLCCLGYSILEIANIFNMSRNNVYLIQRKIKKKFNALQFKLDLV